MAGRALRPLSRAISSSRASCECKLLAEPLVYSIEEVRDIACQSQVTYKRKLIQPRFVPTPFCDGAFPEPTRTKIL